MKRRKECTFTQLRLLRGSIHPQGWVPIETVPPDSRRSVRVFANRCSIHPQGWVPIETGLTDLSNLDFCCMVGSIHPQGWVPIETVDLINALRFVLRSIHPQGWVPIETLVHFGYFDMLSVCSIHPQGWVPIETRRACCNRCPKFRK